MYLNTLLTFAIKRSRHSRIQRLANPTPWVTYLHVIREGIGPHIVRLMAPLMIHIMIDHTMMGDEDH